MRRQTAYYPWRKILMLVSMLLIVVVASLTVLVTHKPQALWNRIAYIAHPPQILTEAERFMTLPPGAKLPSEAECALRVQRDAWEPRPDNSITNHRVPTAQQVAQLAPWGPWIGVSPEADALRKQITGNFTGTTDEILQWVACKWGIDENIVRAEAIAESNWYQSQRGDWTTDSRSCPPATWNGSGCYQSYGILQIKFSVFQSTWPMSRDDTAFNAEYAYAVIRTCYEGWTTYLKNSTPLPGYPRYHAGDIWGCLGRWSSGRWYNQHAISYINTVKTDLAHKAWLQPGF